MFALFSTITGFCPPNSKIVGVKFGAAAAAIIFPFAADPVKIIKSHLCFNNSVYTSGFPAHPKTISWGNSFNILRHTLQVSGAVEAGFAITKFPAAIACTNGIINVRKLQFHAEKIKAKPNGSGFT
jgi:hypothetical protein